MPRPYNSHENSFQPRPATDFGARLAVSGETLDRDLAQRHRSRSTRLAGSPSPLSSFEQGLINLLTNAKDALEGVREKRVTVRSMCEGAWVELVVQDSGRGIAPEIATRIFDPFFTTKAVGKGTGLGLSISYGIVKEHAGTITVESAPGRGTLFVVRLPLAHSMVPVS